MSRWDEIIVALVLTSRGQVFDSMSWCDEGFRLPIDVSCNKCRLTSSHSLLIGQCSPRPIPSPVHSTSRPRTSYEHSPRVWGSLGCSWGYRFKRECLRMIAIVTNQVNTRFGVLVGWVKLGRSERVDTVPDKTQLMKTQLMCHQVRTATQKLS
ncbi:hypothetical protein Pmani_014468 [Petrolisthes manimaculis]|uniref:Uncharacterized protein n=1 Tax=Petrolisthes manimaculis TaxID=1843537 RepID=A0AAE1UCL1_9EUCA|nr:hypothetical protein Pmani_014468 [Petrolisthes manimaculis]